MHSDSIVFSIFLIFTGAAVLATVALYARQAMLVAYLVLGALLGPAGFGWITDADLISDIAHVGIIFLLFLLGLNLYPQKVVEVFRETLFVTLLSSVLFAILGYSIAWFSGLSPRDCLLVGIAVTFSSTIIGLKLLPTTALHHRHTGELVIGVLLIQDFLAISALLVLHGLEKDNMPVTDIGLLVLSLPALVLFAYLTERYFINLLFKKFDRIQEYIFLLALGWCLGMAQLAQSLGLSYEIGAFIAGVAVATNPIARFIAESLRPLRDFFLVMFFFALGAGFDFASARAMWFPALLLAGCVLFCKPMVFRFLLVRSAETNKLAWEIGFRLGQLSEFSLLIVFIALEAQLMSTMAANLIQMATMITFIGSSYLVIFRYPTPIAVDARLRRD